MHSSTEKKQNGNIADCGSFEKPLPIAQAMSLVLAVCGMPGSGKGEFASIFIQQDIPVLSMGDMIRAEVASRGLEESPNIFGEIASELRAEFGEEVLAVRLADKIDLMRSEHNLILIEGLRGTAERDIFQNRWKDEFKVVGIRAEKEVRFQRIMKRNRSEDGDRNSFETRDEREKGWGLEQLITQADYILENRDPLSEFYKDTRDLLAEIKR